MSDFGETFARAFIKQQDELKAAKELISLLQTENSKLREENEKLKRDSNLGGTHDDLRLPCDS